MKISYPARGFVSVWVGTFETEDLFDSCVDRSIEMKLGLETDLARFCEVSFEHSVVLIDDLLRGFSGWERYLSTVTQPARDRGIEFANAALVCFNLKCEEAPDQWGEMKFLGSFPDSVDHP
jgi:hypothetical protein